MVAPWALSLLEDSRFTATGYVTILASDGPIPADFFCPSPLLSLDWTPGLRYTVTFRARVANCLLALGFD